MYVCTYVRTHARTHVCMHACMHAYTYIQACMYVYYIASLMLKPIANVRKQKCSSLHLKVKLCPLVHLTFRLNRYLLSKSVWIGEKLLLRVCQYVNVLILIYQCFVKCYMHMHVHINGFVIKWSRVHIYRYDLAKANNTIICMLSRTCKKLIF